MRSVTTLLLLLTFTSLSCASSTVKFGDERKGECGEVPVGVKIDKGQLDMAGATMGDFSLGNLNIQFTPEFQRIISDAATNALVQDYISCKVIERAGVQKDPELVDYFTNLTYFLSSKPTGEQQTKWRQENPFPGKKGNSVSQNPSISLNVVGDRNVFYFNAPPLPPAPNSTEKEVKRELAELRKELTSVFERVEQEYAEGNRYFKEGKFDTAISHFTNAIDLVPEIPSLYLALGNTLLAMNRFKDSVATYNRGLKGAKPSEKVYVDLLASRASAKDGLGYYQEAIDDLSLAIKFNSNYALAYYNRGVLKGRRLGDFQGAITDFTKAIDLDPNAADAYTNRCAAKGLLKDFQGSISDCTRAIELNPGDALAYFNRGLTKGLAKDFQGAIADHTMAIKLNPDYAYAYLSRGAAKGWLNDLQGAIADFTMAIKLDPDDAQAYFNRGVAKYLLNDFQGAIDDYTMAINHTPSEGAYNARGFAQKALGNQKQATDDFYKARELRRSGTRIVG